MLCQGRKKMVFDAVPDAYDQRVPAFIKHKLLEGYLQKLFLIVGMNSRGRSIEICYVDCFAGPWGDESESMDSTSIAISLRILEDCRQALVALNVKPKMRALFIEKDRTAFKRLEDYLRGSTPSEIESRCRMGDFVELRDEILSWAGRDAFTFFFVDPKGWKDVGIEKLRPLLERPRSELLVNFMYNFVNRTMSIPALQNEMIELVGERINLDALNSEDRERLILNTYRTNLKACVPKQNERFPPRSAYVRVLHHTNDRTWYHLVYVTSHPKGIVEFMKLSETVEVVQGKVRATRKAAKREEQTGVVDMFSDVDDSFDFQAGRARDGDVDQFWLNYLESGSRRVGLHEFAGILEKTDWFPSDLQSSLVRLIASGTVRNLDATGNRPKLPLHYEQGQGERLELIDQSS